MLGKSLFPYDPDIIGIAGFKNPSYMEFFKKTRNFRGKEFTRLVIMCYNIHGISPPFML